MQEFFMQEALQEAKRALYLKEVPVGAIIVKENKIISRAHNLKETLNDVTAHAEVLAIKSASEALSNWRLTGCDMYVTLEPCPMCASIIMQSRIRALYIGTYDPNMGACGSVLNLIQEDRLNHAPKVVWTYNEACSIILKDFFKHRR